MLTTTHPTSVADLKANLGEELGVSGWHDVTQAEVDAFAEATGDCQWIHTNPERARTTPFGGTIAHGYYTLSLAPALWPRSWRWTALRWRSTTGWTSCASRRRCRWAIACGCARAWTGWTSSRAGPLSP